MPSYYLNFFPRGILILILIAFSSEIFATILPIGDNKSFDIAVESLRKGNYDEALRSFEEAYVKESISPDSIMLARILGNIGIVNYQLSLFDKAIVYHLRSEEIYKEIGEKGLVWLAKVQVNLALCYMKNSDMGKALPYFENAERIFQKLNMTKSPEYESLLNNLAAFYMVNSNYRKALEYNQKAFSIRTKDLKEYKKWESKGYIFYKTKEYSNSLKCFYIALKVMERDHGKNSAGKDQLYSNIGQVYLDMEEFDKALECFEQAKGIILKNSGEKNAAYSLCLNRIGLVYQQRKQDTGNLEMFMETKKKNNIEALNYYQKALMAISYGFSSPNFTDNPPIDSILDKTQLLISLKNKAETLNELSALEKSDNGELCRKYLEDALKAYTLSAKVIHIIRTGFINEESRLLLAENEHSVYLGAIDAAVNLFKLTGERKHFELAFAFSERSRSTDFLTMVRNSRAKQFGGMPDSLLQKETELKSEIAAYKNFLFIENSKSIKDYQKLDLWKTKLFDLEQAYSKLISLFEKEYPKYYDFKYADPIVSLKEIQSKLKPREALIEYVENGHSTNKKREIVAFLITKNKYQVYTSEIDSTYDNSINNFLQFLKNGSVYNTRKKDYISYSTSAYKLNNCLLAPFSSELKGYRFIIVPDGKLSYLPFDAFVTSTPDTTKMDFRGLNYLVFDHAVSYSYSATLLYYYFNTTRGSGNGLGAFVPDYNDTRISRFESRERLSPLPGAKIEVAGVTNLMKSKVFPDSEATTENFKANASKFDILHFAMHTMINDSLPMFSKLVFSPVSKNKQSLDTYEIYDMEIKSRMTVLSACNTGSGRLQKGEGVMSLARAFLYAGCPSIVMTLWSVEDESSANLMIDFYKNLLSGYTKDEALRKAKIKHIKSADPLKAHPYYWLGYVSIGDQVALYRTKFLYFVGMIAFVLLAIFSEKLYVRLKVKSNSKHTLD